MRIILCERLIPHVWLGHSPPLRLQPLRPPRSSNSSPNKKITPRNERLRVHSQLTLRKEACLPGAASRGGTGGAQCACSAHIVIVWPFASPCTVIRRSQPSAQVSNEPARVHRTTRQCGNRLWH